MDGNWATNQHYRKLRDAFLLGNEGFRRIVHFDTVGIPSDAKGVAILARNDKPNPGNRRFDLHKGNIAAIKMVVNDPVRNQAIDDFANQALKAIDNTPEPNYHGGKKTPSAFQSTVRGKKLVQVFGPLYNTWEVKDSPRLSDAEAHDVSGKVVDKFEEELDGYLNNIIDPATLTEEQRIVLLDALYHGKWSSGKKAAKAMSENKSIDHVIQCLNDPAFPSRSQNVALLLKKQWPPPKPAKKIPRSRSIKEPGISPEQVSIMREYLLPESQPQQLGISSYEQVMMRYMGAGCDSPLKNVCDPHSDLRRRYGD